MHEEGPSGLWDGVRQELEEQHRASLDSSAEQLETQRVAGTPTGRWSRHEM